MSIYPYYESCIICDGKGMLVLAEDKEEPTIVSCTMCNGIGVVRISKSSQEKEDKENG